MAKKHTIHFSKGKIKQLTAIIEKFSEAKILVLGDFILDQYIWGNVSRISPEAPVPVVDVKRETFVTGGALNAGNNIKELGASVFPCGVIGRDLLGRMFLKRVKEERIDTHGIVVDRTRPTTLKTRVIAHSQQVVRFDRESREEISQVDRKKIIEFCRKKMSDVDGVIIEDYGKGVIMPALLKEVVALAERHKKFVAVDPKEKHFDYYRKVTVITPNKQEAFSAVDALLDTNQTSIEAVGRKLLKQIGCRAVLMTLGEEGMALFERSGTVTRIPTAAREVYDVSGAGDTVIAIFSLALAAGATMYDAALLANLAAGVVVGKFGTATVTREELLQALQK